MLLTLYRQVHAHTQWRVVQTPEEDSDGGGSNAGRVAGATVGAVAAVVAVAAFAWAAKTGRLSCGRGSQQYLAESTSAPLLLAALSLHVLYDVIECKSIHTSCRRRVRRVH